jgi:hypothetical protein
MAGSAIDTVLSGLEVIDLEDCPSFSARPRRPSNPAARATLVERLARTILEDSESILQWLADSALEMCGADSAGISIERERESGADFVSTNVGFQWIATSGQYRRWIDVVIPRRPSACEICLDRGRPQLYRVSTTFLNSIGVDAVNVTDGLMVPWRSKARCGTIWVLAHGRTEAFDQSNLDILELLASFAALSVTRQDHRKQRDYESALLAASGVIKLLALRIHGPLEKMSDLVFTALNGRWEADAADLAEHIAHPLEVLNELVDSALGPPSNRRPN